MKGEGKVLILGKLPPPIGGVSIHVMRLLENLRQEGFTNIQFVDLRSNPLRLLYQICRSKVIHLHLSSPFWQLAFAVFCRSISKKLIITYHGSWGRYSSVGNLAVQWSARLCTIPIVQNKESLAKAVRCNTLARLISTYLPSAEIKPLDDDLSLKLREFRTKYKSLVCTNAWRLTFDKNQKETYGISELIHFIDSQINVGLVISDPSGTYARFINATSPALLRNVLFLSKPHDFRNILKIADAFIRNTTTDGVSLSIYEALEFNVPVLASGKVERAVHCRVYHNLLELDLEVEIREAKRLANGTKIKISDERPIEKLISTYSEVLQK